MRPLAFHVPLFVLALLVVDTLPSRAEYALLWQGQGGYFGVTSLPAEPLGDFDGDGTVEIVTANIENFPVVRIRDAMTGGLEAEIPLATWGGVRVACIAQDLNHDRIPEIIVYSVGDFTTTGTFCVIGSLGPTSSVSGESGTAGVQGAVHPNPFNPSTRIDYALPQPGRVRLCLYDASGRLLRVLLDGKQEAGPQEVVWDGRDDGGSRLPSGTYFYEVRLDSKTVTAGKAVVLK